MYVFSKNEIRTVTQFPSYWRGLYEIIKKMLNVMYKVNCGRRESTEVILGGRLRLKQHKTLFGEKSDDDEV